MSSSKSTPMPPAVTDELRVALERERQRAIIAEHRALALEEALRRSYQMAVQPRRREPEAE
jgi:hypothetical protein